MWWPRSPAASARPWSASTWTPCPPTSTTPPAAGNLAPARGAGEDRPPPQRFNRVTPCILMPRGPGGSRRMGVRCAKTKGGGTMTPARPVIGVLAVQGDVPEHLRALEAAGARPAPVRRPEDLDRLDGLVIPGGESTTLWRLSVAFEVLEPLRKLIGEGPPPLGSRAGMVTLGDRRA